MPTLSNERLRIVLTLACYTNRRDKLTLCYIMKQGKVSRFNRFCATKVLFILLNVSFQISFIQFYNTIIDLQIKTTIEFSSKGTWHEWWGSFSTWWKINTVSINNFLFIRREFKVQKLLTVRWTVHVNNDNFH